MTEIQQTFQERLAEAFSSAIKSSDKPVNWIVAHPDDHEKFISAIPVGGYEVNESRHDGVVAFIWGADVVLNKDAVLNTVYISCAESREDAIGSAVTFLLD
jgi:hypothetical protein